MIKIISLALLFITATVTETWSQEKIDLEKWITEAESILERADNYTAIFHKQERINRKLNEEETIFIKFKKPFKIYMKWIKDPFNGREALYVTGWNENRIKFHEGGILGVVNLNLDPTGSLGMKGNRHPITHSGIEYLVKNIKKDLCKGIKAGEFKLKEHGEEIIYGRKTKHVEGIFPKDKSKGYYCYRIIMNLDIENKVPIKVKVFDWDDKLIECYGYEDLKLNAGLTFNDFDPKNPEYRF